MERSQVGRVFAQTQRVIDAKTEADNIAKERPEVPIPEFEGMTDIEAFDAMAQWFKGFLSADQYAHRTGLTPELPIEITDEETGRTFLTTLLLEFDLSIGIIESEWNVLDDNSEKLDEYYRHESIRRGLLTEGSSYSMGYTWSMYRDAFNQLTQEQARELGFPEAMAQTLPAAAQVVEPAVN